MLEQGKPWSDTSHNVSVTKWSEYFTDEVTVQFDLVEREPFSLEFDYKFDENDIRKALR